MVYEFSVSFLTPPGVDPIEHYLDDLYEAGLSDCFVGSFEGKLVVDVVREGSSQQDVVDAIIESVKSAIPEANFLGIMIP